MKRKEEIQMTLLPRVLVNAMPKNGTHLLLSTLANMTGFSDSQAKQVHWGKNNREQALATLEKTLPGQYSKAHLPFNQRIINFLMEHDFRVLNMQRDPRDNVVSLLFYIRRYQHHPFHPVLDGFDDDEALMMLINGFEGLPRFNSIDKRLQNWLGWFDHPYCLTVRFENLIGESGGGSRLQQQQQLVAILSYLGCGCPEDKVSGLAEKIINQKSHSFRKGQIGDWKNHFKAAHSARFKALANDFLLRYGYEQDCDW
ncbi:MAG: sulfotransferase domain-containing protein [Pseudomonadales bacterium]|nr:sulfotransferase domain-containing protein [Pseudomonadales bacterium]